VNITIVNEGARRGFKWAALIGSGATAMEVLYCAIAFTGFAAARNDLVSEFLLFPGSQERGFVDLAEICLQGRLCRFASDATWSIHCVISPHGAAAARFEQCHLDQLPV
jgi:hypothetical protein